MKLITCTFIMGLFLILISEKVIAQDEIITKSGKTLNGDITKVADDVIHINMKLNDKMSKTYISWDQVEDYSIGKIEKIRTELDTSLFYSIKLEDGTGLMGKIKTIDKSTILYDDNNLGIITIKGETIQSYSAENKSTVKIEVLLGSLVAG